MSFISDQIRCLDVNADIIAHDSTNSIIQVIAKGQRSFGLQNGLGDPSRREWYFAAALIRFEQ